tara:strand:+ start:50 stop:448 length:399 start_codon:yes stop_codon:yes gene_type:complete
MQVTCIKIEEFLQSYGLIVGVINIYYLVNEGIDTGEILFKKKYEIKKHWCLFRTYCEILMNSSDDFRILINTYLSNNEIKFESFDNNLNLTSYNSWPNKELDDKMKMNKRNYIKLDDIKFINRKLIPFLAKE